MNHAARSALLLLAVTAGCANTAPSSSDEEIAALAAILGRSVPDVTLTTPAGDSVALRERIGAGPVLLFVLDEEDCISCANFAFEARVLQRTQPELDAVFVAVGDTTVFMRYFRQNRLTDLLLLDARGDLPAAFGTGHTPLALVVDSARVLFMDFRAPASAGRQPLSPLLTNLRAVLSPPSGAGS